ncbi:oligosaccharide flippase family protein [Jannaschia ovalis]|uniref:Oligosaccharide flippase family protein n=1 Tax=Jannaschia ovalis TaxID=3038773 RepID=A0ABY8LB50_9RHOB|nr:oligosaccharide flippase family protein [Jannaschia sp. GRR-S6-38]WGH77270.1 oligosaccharide flippase family protein [Jannaschia sp. GRR-S6-38]
MLRSAFLLLSGNAAHSALLFARNLALAALIPVEDYGIAATLVVAIAAVEMASAFGLQQQIVQARDGDDPRLQDALQGFQLFRGLLATLLMLALAWPLAWFFAVPQVAWGYAALALVPFCNALQHFDMHRYNRAGRFGALIGVQTTPALVSLILIWPLAWWLGDWRVMLGALVAYAALAAILSHVVAERRFRPVFDAALWGRTLRFGWPILLNAGLLFFVMQGDKMIVGRLAGMESLSSFALAVTLTLTPSLVLAGSLGTASLPKLSELADRQADFAGATARFIALCILCGMALGLVGLVGASILPAFVAGTAWAPLATLVGPMAVMQGIRLAKTGPALSALARGDTANAVVSNLPRIAALIVGWVALSNGADVLWLVWLGCAAEGAGLVLSAWAFARAAGTPLPWRSLALAAAGFGILVAAAVALG